MNFVTLKQLEKFIRKLLPNTKIEKVIFDWGHDINQLKHIIQYPETLQIIHYSNGYDRICERGYNWKLMEPCQSEIFSVKTNKRFCQVTEITEDASEVWVEVKSEKEIKAEKCKK